MRSRLPWLVVTVSLAACTKKPPTTPTTIRVPVGNVQPGGCAEPGRDGVMSNSPKVDHADRDLDNDGRDEIIVVDRAQCTGDGNCYWNVFRQPRDPSDAFARCSPNGAARLSR